MVILRSSCDFFVGQYFTKEMIQNTFEIISNIGKFLMVIVLGAIELLINFKRFMKSGFKPMLHGLYNVSFSVCCCVCCLIYDMTSLDLISK